MTIWTIALLAFLFLLACGLLFGKTSKRRNLPPGPKGLPIIGYAPFLRPPMFLSFTNLKQKYGDVVRLQVGSLPFVVLNSYSVLKEAMIDNADNFAGRLQSSYINRVSRGAGIIFTDSALWQEHRRFSLKVLRDFGVGKSISEEIVRTEIESFQEYLDAHLGVPLETSDIFSRGVSNVICTIAFGMRPGYDDKEFTIIMKKMHYIAHMDGFLSILPIIFPVLSHLVPLVNAIVGKRRAVIYTEDGHEYIRQKIEEVRRHQHLDQTPTNLTEAYLIEQKRLEDRGEKHTFTDWQLMRLIFELFIAGTDTSSTTLCWALVLLSLHPEVQRKIEAEVDERLDRSRLPTMSDRKQLNYTLAVIDEIVRYTSIAPTAIPHRNFHDATVGGYTIPANSIVVPNIYAVHHDPDTWAKPDDFYPEHFINPDTGKYEPRDQLVIFGIGRRSCLGESLAKTEVFLFFLFLVQRYTVRLDEYPAKDKLADFLIGTEGTVRAPKPHKIIFEKR